MQLLTGATGESLAPTPTPRRMTLVERQAYRRELLYQSVREALGQLEALACMYRFTVQHVDDRHHRFVVMMEVTPMFQVQQEGQALSFAQIESVLRVHAYEHYGIVLERMHWRIDDTQMSFARDRRAGDPANASIKPQTPLQRLQAPRYGRLPLEALSPRQREQFAQALAQGQQPPALQVGLRIYQSDQMPLEPDPGQDTQPCRSI